MKRIMIYGVSDDSIEIDGDIKEKFDYREKKHPKYLAFSDGTVLSIFYSNKGIWEIRRIAKGDAEYTKMEAPENPIDGNNSDIVTLESNNIRWIVLGNKIMYPNSDPEETEIYRVHEYYEEIINE